MKFETGPERAEALRKWAHGDLHCMAAAELLIDHDYWPRMLDATGYLETWGRGAQTMARPRFVQAIRILERAPSDDHPRVAFETASSSEEDVLYIAASLAVGHKINLSRRLQSFDSTNARRVVRAIGIATRQVPV